MTSDTPNREKPTCPKGQRWRRGADPACLWSSSQRGLASSSAALAPEAPVSPPAPDALWQAISPSGTETGHTWPLSWSSLSLFLVAVTMLPPNRFFLASPWTGALRELFSSGCSLLGGPQILLTSSFCGTGEHVALALSLVRVPHCLHLGTSCVSSGRQKHTSPWDGLSDSAPAHTWQCQSPTGMGRRRPSRKGAACGLVPAHLPPAGVWSHFLRIHPQASPGRGAGAGCSGGTAVWSWPTGLRGAR